MDNRLSTRNAAFLPAVPGRGAFAHAHGELTQLIQRDGNPSFSIAGSRDALGLAILDRVTRWVTARPRCRRVA